MFPRHRRLRLRRLGTLHRRRLDNIVLENNVVYRTKTGGFHQHYGKDNLLRNNVFAFSATDQLQRTRTEPHSSFVFERNIVYWDGGGPLLGHNWSDNNFTLRNNVYWNSAGHAVRFPGNLTLPQWQARRGQDQGSLVADPKFVNAATTISACGTTRPRESSASNRWTLGKPAAASRRY